MTSIAEKIANWVVQTSRDDIPRNAIENAKRSVIGTIDVGLASSTTTLAAMAERYVTGHYANGKCNVIGSNKRLSAPGAAFANCIAMRVLD